MFDWLWTWGPMATVQGWVDATRAWVDPLWLIVGCFAVGLICVWRLSQPATTRDVGTQGAHYLGNITPKKLPAMLVTPEKKKKAKSRAEMTRAIRKGADRRRAAEKRSGRD